MPEIACLSTHKNIKKSVAEAQQVISVHKAEGVGGIMLTSREQVGREEGERSLTCQALLTPIAAATAGGQAVTWAHRGLLLVCHSLPPSRSRAVPLVAKPPREVPFHSCPQIHYLSWDTACLAPMAG